MLNHLEPRRVTVGDRRAKLYLGRGPLALEVVVVALDGRPRIADLRAMFRAPRRAGADRGALGRGTGGGVRPDRAQPGGAAGPAGRASRGRMRQGTGGSRTAHRDPASSSAASPRWTRRSQASATTASTQGRGVNPGDTRRHSLQSHMRVEHLNKRDQSRLTRWLGEASRSPRVGWVCIFVVAVLKRLLVAPSIPKPLISRPARLWPHPPSAPSAAWTRGPPYVSPLPVQIDPTRASISASRRAGAEGGRLSQS